MAKKNLKAAIEKQKKLIDRYKKLLEEKKIDFLTLLWMLWRNYFKKEGGEEK